MTIYFLVVFGFYFLLLLILLVGLSIATRERNDSLKETKFISVLVAMRNEADNIENLLQCLSVQNYPARNFEIILVDDHSKDGSEQKAKKWLDRISALRVISLDEQRKGKKAALSLAISKAKGELIATTDADCKVPPNWLKNINDRFQFAKTNMCIGAVALQNENTFFSKLQSIEFSSVMSTSISLAAIGKPIMCNGANLSFRKKIFEDVEGYQGNEHIASGDDEFLMRKMVSKYPNSITTMIDSVVVTSPQPSLKDFIHQRLRWASKWKHNTSFFARLLAIFIFVVQLSWLVLNVLPIFYPLPIFIALLVSKVYLDLIVLSHASRSLGMKFSLPAFAVLQLLYPIYVLYVGIFSMRKNHLWKGRPIG